MIVLMRSDFEIKLKEKKGYSVKYIPFSSNLSLERERYYY